MNSEEISELENSIYRSMLGYLGKNLIGVHGIKTGDKIILTGFFAQNPDESDIEDLQIMSSEVIADYPNVNLIEEKWEIGVPELEQKSFAWVENSEERLK